MPRSYEYEEQSCPPSKVTVATMPILTNPSAVRLAKKIFAPLLVTASFAGRFWDIIVDQILIIQQSDCNNGGDSPINLKGFTMNAGEIGEAAGRIFNYKAPLNWIIRSQEDQNDHGIDCEIELKDSNGRALGQESVFKIQLKGQRIKRTAISFCVFLPFLLGFTLSCFCLCGACDDLSQKTVN